MSKIVIENGGARGGSKIPRAVSGIGQPIYHKANYRLRTVFAPQKHNYKPYTSHFNSRMLPQHRPAFNPFPSGTHVKRWPPPEAYGVRLLAEFGLKRFHQKNLYERMHDLPFRGVGCLFSRRIGKSKWPTGTFFKPQSVKYRLRPFLAKVRGDMFCKGKKMISDISPRGSTAPYWSYCYHPQAPWWNYRPPFPQPFLRSSTDDATDKLSEADSPTSATGE